MPDALILFYILLVLVAFLYSSVGHGGASGYLALMALFGFLPEVMRPTALVLNILVAGLAFWHYARAGHFRWALFRPFALASIPAAFVGGLWDVDPLMYKKILGVLLLFAVGRMVFQPRDPGTSLRLLHVPAAWLTGAAIGLLSGLIGMGGGILLSPLLLLFRWADMRQTAAVSALFILVNSAAGLIGLGLSGITWDPYMPLMIGLAFAGGMAGSWMGARHLPLVGLRAMLAIVLIVASFKLIFT